MPQISRRDTLLLAAAAGLARPASAARPAAAAPPTGWDRRAVYPWDAAWDADAASADTDAPA